MRNVTVNKMNTVLYTVYNPSSALCTKNTNSRHCILWTVSVSTANFQRSLFAQSAVTIITVYYMQRPYTLYGDP